jgi:hypothetical protein
MSGTVSELGPALCMPQCGMPRHTAVQLLEVCSTRRSIEKRHCLAAARPVYDWVPNLKTLPEGTRKWAIRYLFAIGCNHNISCQCCLTEGAYCICRGAQDGGPMRSNETTQSSVDPGRVNGWKFVAQTYRGWGPLVQNPYVKPHPDLPGIVLPVPEFRKFATPVCNRVVAALDAADAIFTRMSLLFPHIAQLRSVIPEMLDDLLEEMLDQYERQLRQYHGARPVLCAKTCTVDCQSPQCAESAKALAASDGYLAAVTQLCSTYCQKFDTTPGDFKKALETAASGHRLQRLRKRFPGIDLTVDMAAHTALVVSACGVHFERILPNVERLHQQHVCAVVCGESCRDRCVDPWGHPIVSASAVNQERIDRIMAEFKKESRAHVQVGADALHRARHHGECQSLCSDALERERARLDSEMAAQQPIPERYHRWLDSTSLVLFPATRNCPKWTTTKATTEATTETLRAALSEPLFVDPASKGSFVNTIDKSATCGVLRAPDMEMSDEQTELHKGLIDELRAAVVAAAAISAAAEDMTSEARAEFTQLLVKIGDLKEVIDYYEAVYASHRRQIRAFHHTLATTASKRATDHALQGLFEAAVEKATAMDPTNPMLVTFTKRLAETYEMVRIVNEGTPELSMGPVYLKVAGRACASPP